MPVTVAITNYNSFRFLRARVREVQAHGFDDVVVLDDGSSDMSVDWARRQPGVRVVAGESNLGPTGNRNRILDLETRDLILFLDVDEQLLGEPHAPRLEKLFAEDPAMGACGPLIYALDGQPMWFNWGYDFNRADADLGHELMQLARQHWNDPVEMAVIAERARGRVANLEPVMDRHVDWVVEQYFAIRAGVFRELGGFDAGFRMFHEGPDLCLRVRRAGHTVRLITELEARHLALRSGTAEQRWADEQASTRYFFEKYPELLTESGAAGSR